MFREIFINIIANLAVAFILGFISFATFFTFFILERQKLLRFFGISRINSGLRIYVSRLEVIPGGTTGFETITKGYIGPAIIRIEYMGGLLISEIIRSRILSYLPTEIKDWLGGNYITLLDINPIIDVSPKTLDEVASDNLISLGSVVYNIVTKHYLEQPSSRFYFTKNLQGERAICFKSTGMEDVEIPGRSMNRELAVIQRVNDFKSGRTVFICAGLASSATYGAARYLVENWRTIQRKYSESEFGICLAFPNQSRDGDKVVRPIVVYESSKL